MKPYVGLLLRLLLSFGLLAVLLRTMDVQMLGRALSQVSFPILILGFLAKLSAVGVAGLGWLLVIPASAPDIGARLAVRSTVVGFAFNSVVPFSGLMGDLYRGLVLVRHGTRSLTAAFSLLAARWCSMLALASALWLVLALVLQWWPERRLDLAGQPIGLPQLTALCAMTASGLFLAFSGALLLPDGLLYCFRPFLRLSPAWLPEVRTLIGTLSRSLGAVSASFGASLLSLFLQGLSIYAVAVAMGCPGETLPFLVLAPLMRILHQVPGFVNGIGIQEAATILVGEAFGISREQSLCISLLVHVLRLGVVVTGFTLFLQSPLALSAAQLLRGRRMLPPVDSIPSSNSAS